MSCWCGSPRHAEGTPDWLRNLCDLHGYYVGNVTAHCYNIYRVTPEPYNRSMGLGCNHTLVAVAGKDRPLQYFIDAVKAWEAKA